MSELNPGEILLEDYLIPMRISQNSLARALGISPRSINEIVLGRRSITPEMSLKLGKFFKQTAQFNSFRDPFIILLGSVPLAMFGALIFTFLKMPAPDVPFWTNGWTTTMNIYSQIGLVTLIGLIAKNGILIVEFANHMQRDGHSKLEAVRSAALTRLRPILMTSLATVFGHFPLVFVTGAGAAARNSIGLVLVGGMTIGTLFTLLIVPSLYMLIAKEQKKHA